MSSHAEGIGAESIGFNDFVAGLQVVVVNAANQFGLRKIELVIRPVDKNTFGVKQGAHRAIAQDGKLVYPAKKVARHIVAENTGSELVCASRRSPREVPARTRLLSGCGEQVCYNP